MTSTVFSTVLIANRGEIAVRVIRTLRSLGIRSVAVYSDADAGAPHVRLADIAVRLGPASPAESYLHIERVIDAARTTGADAVHPGYGFLAENAIFAEACAAAGIVFIGPPPSAIRAMGDKISAKALVASAGVRVVPGRNVAGLSDAELIDAAADVGYPVIVKPSAGGGGKGMRVVADPASLPAALASARREATTSFGDDTLLVERYIATPRHIEIQVLADTHGAVVHLGERECSLQRRHQKIIEEAPSALLTPSQREAMGAQAVEAARACGYTGAGTVEMIVAGDKPDDFFFMEMNTRLQVEHPVTEMVYGLDLVEWQLRVAAGATLPWTQDELVPHGHAVEARVCAEDPRRDFVPTGGSVAAVEWPSGDGIRVDAGVAAGSSIGTNYDSMIAKVIAFGPDRASALRRLGAALGATRVIGITTNSGLLAELTRDPDVIAGRLDTGLVERRLADAHLSEGAVGAGASERLAALHRGTSSLVRVACAVARLGGVADHDAAAALDPWARRDGWRHGSRSWIRQRLQLDGPDPIDVALRAGVALRADANRWEAELDGDALGAVEVDWSASGSSMRVRADGIAVDVEVRRIGGSLWVWHAGRSIEVRAAAPAIGGRGATAGGTGPVRSPMPGSVVAVLVAVGDHVVEGQAVAIVEAMKMEYTLSARAPAVVIDIHARAGQQVALDEPVVTLGPIHEGNPTP